LTLAAIAWVIIFQMMIKHVAINGSRELTAIYQAHAQDQTIKSYESDVMKYFEIRRAQIRLQCLPQGLGIKDLV